MIGIADERRVPAAKAWRPEPLTRAERQLDELQKRVAAALDADGDPLVANSLLACPRPPQVDVWGVPFSQLGMSDVLRRIDQLLAARQGAFFITANLNYCMLTARTAGLPEVNAAADFVICDGMPILWWSRWLGRPLPERVAGSDLIYALSQWAAARGYRLYLLGGAAGVAQRAADKLQSIYAGLQVAGVESPPYRPLTDDEEAALAARIRESRADLILVALGQPKGEHWLAQRQSDLGGAVGVQLGASFDFVAGGVPRAPRWMQASGLEWTYRLWREPRRLAGRYWVNFRFLAGAVWRDFRQARAARANRREPTGS